MKGKDHETTNTDHHSTILPRISKTQKLVEKKDRAPLQTKPNQGECESLTINFRDTTYNVDAGSYYPVEIVLLKEEESLYQIQYLTDFAYMCNVYPELERNVDFDIANRQTFIAPMGWQSCHDKSIVEFYSLWEGNLVAYLQMEAYDEIKITSN